MFPFFFFPFFFCSALDLTNRYFYIAANGVPGLVNTTLLFTQKLANDLSNSTIVFSSNFTLNSALVSLEAVNGTLYAVFQSGLVASVNAQTGATSVVGNLLPNGPGSDNRFVVSTSVDVATGRIFATTQNAALNRDWQFATIVLATGKVTTKALQRINDPVFFGDLSTLFSHIWVSCFSSLP